MKIFREKMKKPWTFCKFWKVTSTLSMRMFLMNFYLRYNISLLGDYGLIFDEQKINHMVQEVKFGFFFLTLKSHI